MHQCNLPLLHNKLQMCELLHFLRIIRALVKHYYYDSRNNRSINSLDMHVAGGLAFRIILVCVIILNLFLILLHVMLVFLYVCLYI